MINAAKRTSTYTEEYTGSVSYELTNRNTHMFYAEGQLLTVEIGQLWVSIGGEDYIVRSGASLRLNRAGDGLVTIAPIRTAFVAYTLHE